MKRFLAIIGGVFLTGCVAFAGDVEEDWTQVKRLFLKKKLISAAVLGQIERDYSPRKGTVSYPSSGRDASGDRIPYMMVFKVKGELKIELAEGDSEKWEIRVTDNDGKVVKQYLPK